MVQASYSILNRSAQNSINWDVNGVCKMIIVFGVRKVRLVRLKVQTCYKNVMRKIVQTRSIIVQIIFTTRQNPISFGRQRVQVSVTRNGEKSLNGNFFTGEWRLFTKIWRLFENISGNTDLGKLVEFSGLKKVRLSFPFPYFGELVDEITIKETNDHIWLGAHSLSCIAIFYGLQVNA